MPSVDTSARSTHPQSSGARIIISLPEKKEHGWCSSASLEAARPKPFNPPIRSSSTRPTAFPLIPGRLSFAAHASVAVTHREIHRYPDRFYFSSNYQYRYAPFCLDFGPVDLAVVHKFCRFMRKFWGDDELQDRELVYFTENTLESRTNTAFLLAAFMVVDLGYSPADAWAPFAKMPKDWFATFRDATFCEQKYGLTVLACLQGLMRAFSLGWYSPESFNIDDHMFLQTVEAGDMHQVSPKFIAFKGPLDPTTQPTDDVMDRFALPPEHYVEAFKELGVSAVVRLNEASTYHSESFTEEGIAHHDLYFNDCTMPDSATVRAFLEAVEAVEGVVAVHCRAGLGRTGTLIAVYFMEHHGFTAAEAIGWLRIVRPGSVIGDQQHFLHWYEATRGGTVTTDLPREKLFQLMSDATTGDAPLLDPEELGRMVKRAQVEKARRQEAAATPSSPFDSPGATTPTPTRPVSVDAMPVPTTGGRRKSWPLRRGSSCRDLGTREAAAPAPRRSLGLLRVSVLIKGAMVLSDISRLLVFRQARQHLPVGPTEVSDH